MKKHELMGDDKSNAGGTDRKRITLNEDFEVRDGAEKFGVTEEQLRAAVEQVAARPRTSGAN